VDNIDVFLKEEMKTAMRSRDQRTLNVVRMVRARMTERLKEPDGPREASDVLWREVIAAYARQMEKAAEEFRKAGERGAEKLAEAEFEVGYLAKFLPAKLAGAALEELVRQVIAQTGATTARDIGKVMGAVMKEHKEQVDGNEVRRVAQSLLGG
jgi:hypothetical protein